eukprot:m.33400 g.33400  ORF g.33400 m.33400 type:complete len:272 (-) comp12231_c0_seq1:300-1115(-)
MGNSKSKAQDADPETSITFEDEKRRSRKGSKGKKKNSPSKPKDILGKGPVVAQEEEPSSGSPSVDLANKSKKAASRLTVDISNNAAFANEKPEGNAVGRKASRLFTAPKGPERSKIYQALNPDKLFFESRRDQEEKGKVALGRLGARDYNQLRDEDGNIIPEEDDDEEYVDDEADYDTDDAPDFGELEEEMKALRERRSQAEDAKRAELRKQWEARKAQEEAERQAELEAIRAKEASLEAAKEENNDDFVTETQQRIARESSDYFSSLSFN